MTKSESRRRNRVLMEVRAGATRIQSARAEAVVQRFATKSVQPVRNFHAAADLYRATRKQDFTVRSMVDCPIATVAIRTGAVLLHRDRDFEVLSSVAVDLRREPAPD